MIAPFRDKFLTGKREEPIEGGNDEKVYLHSSCFYAHVDVYRMFCNDDAGTAERIVRGAGRRVWS